MKSALSWWSDRYAPTISIVMTSLAARFGAGPRWRRRRCAKRTGAFVTATLSTTHSPLPPASVLFTVPPAYRPPFLLWRDVVGRVVQADGTPHPAYPDPYPFRLWVHPDGTVRQGLQADPEGERSLAYDLTVSWGTTPAANDQAVLALLDQRWFGTAVLSATPPRERHEYPTPSHPYWDEWPGARTLTVKSRVLFNDHDRVTVLVVRGHPGSASIPSELGQLRQLERLELSGTDMEFGTRKSRLTENKPLPPGLTGPIPPALGRLTHLQELHLRDHLLTGSIPPALGRLTRLQELDLSHNLLAGTVPPELGQLTRLRRLYLNDNWLTALPPELGQLGCLQELWLHENWLVTLPPELGQLMDLRGLSLRYNLLTVLPPEVGQLAHLQWLDLMFNRLTLIPPELGQLTHLHRLNLSGNRLDALPAELGQLAHLERLYVNDNRLTALPPELGQLTHLTNLGISNNRLTLIPPELGQLTQLEKISIFDNPLTGCLPATWLARWPDLTVISFATDGQVTRRRLPACPA